MAPWGLFTRLASCAMAHKKTELQALLFVIEHEGVMNLFSHVFALPTPVYSFLNRFKLLPGIGCRSDGDDYLEDPPQPLQLTTPEIGPRLNRRERH